MNRTPLWSVVALVSLGLALRTGFASPDRAVVLSGGLCLVTELAAVRLPSFGFFSTGFSVALALASSEPGHQFWAVSIMATALALRGLGRGGGWRWTVADLAPSMVALAGLSILASWQARCLAGIVLYYLVSELCHSQLALGESQDRQLRHASTREWTALYRWSILVLAPVLVCLHLFQPEYVLLGLPILAGVQRAAFSELARLKLLDQEILLRQQAEAQAHLAQTQSQLDQTTRHLRLREFSEAMLLELTRALSLSQDVHHTAQAALHALSNRVHYRQMAVFVTEKYRLRPLFWIGHSAPPELPMMVEQQAVAGKGTSGPVSVWPLETEGALMVDTQGVPPLAPEEVYLISLVASQTALGLQSARRFREQQQTQAGALLASKMAAVGQLAAGVAHELNTPLGAVQLQLELTAMQPGLNAHAQKALDVAQKAVEHAQKIIGRLLYYSREGASERQHIDLNQVVHDTLQLMNHQLQIEKIEVQTQLCSDCSALVNANEIQQVLTNLILNAKDACLEPGALGRKILILTQKTDRLSLLEVRDQGSGIPEAIRERIFDPFFTSKPVGKGVGLGLSVSQELVTQQGGQITAHKLELPWATAFRLSFPSA